MKPRSHILLAVILAITGIIIPAAHAFDPLFIVPAPPGAELSAIVISHDGSTIVAGGDQLIALSRDGTKLWAGWSGTFLDISGNGEYIVTSQGRTVRLFDRQGIMLWDHSLGATVTDISMTPDASMIAAGGGNTVQSWYNSGSGLGQNVTDTVNDIKISPVRDQVIVATTKALRSFNMSYVPNWYDDTINPGTIEISGDGTGIVIPNGNRIRMYHGSGTRLWDRSFPGGNIISIAYSRDGSAIVAGRDDSSVIAVDRSGNLLWTGNAGFWVTSVGISDNGSTIATGSIDNNIRVFDRQGTLIGSYQTKNPIKSRSVAVSGDGSLIVAADESNVYGFSRSGFSVAATTPVQEVTGNVSIAASLNTTPIGTTLPVPEIIPSIPGNEPVMTTGTTPSSGFPWLLTLVPLLLVILTRKK